MAEFITKCPHCNAELQVQNEWIGMEVECPQCKKMFVIQENSLQMQNKQMVSPPKIQISIKELQDQVIVKAKQFFKSKKIVGISIIAIVFAGVCFSLYNISNLNKHKTNKNLYTSDKISVSVTVKDWMSPDDKVKYSCEYKLYADNQLIASRNSCKLSADFLAVEMKKGACLRAEMLIKNTYGGIEKTLEGPSSYKKMINVFANQAGESFIIECCDLYK